MQALPSISDAEWEVMAVLWDQSPLMASDLVERLAGPNGTRGWSPRTVKTLLNRLVKKGALSYETQGKRYLYRPALRREQCVRAESRSFLSRVFGGAVGPMLVHFATHADLSPEEVEALQRVLARKRAAPAPAPKSDPNTVERKHAE
jgi:BlaI family penicillinase repressor